MKLREPEIDVIEPSRPAPVKYLHACGSRPLEGFTIKRGVGRGGFGEVYFATSDAGKEVALKLIRRNLEVELRGVTHCLNLKHPNLVALYDIRTDDMGDQWVVMEYVCGESLEQVIERHPDGVPIDEAMWWIRGICAGVGYLHDHGIVHRDLKPGNVFLDEGTVKIGDYGLSKFISCSRRSGQTESVGTVHYMAPEIANGRYGREIDTYALGVILYEVLTGHVPFEGESVGEVLMKHLTAEPSLDRVPQQYREIVRRALAKDPDARLSSVNELLELLPAANQESGAQGPASAPIRFYGDGRSSTSGVLPSSTFTPRGYGKSAALHDDVLPEPIAKTIREGLEGLAQGWESWTTNPVAKAVVAVGAIFAAIMTAGAWFPLVLFGLFIYCIYYPVWAWFIRPGLSPPKKAEPTTARQSIAATPIAHAPPTPQPTWHEQAAERKRRRYNWREQALQELAAKPLREKTTELLGSMLFAGVACLVLSGIGTLTVFNDVSRSYGGSFPLFLWLSTVSSIGCWSILAVNKLVEGRIEDQVPPRMMQLLAGLLVGLVAFGISAVLWIGLPTWTEIGPNPSDTLAGDFLSWQRTSMESSWRTGVVSPSLASSVGYFALLFVVLRWWRLAEYTRTVRVSSWSVAWITFAAWLLHLGWWFPQPTGLAVAAIIAASTQLASPWMPPSRRRELAARALA